MKAVKMFLFLLFLTTISAQQANKAKQLSFHIKASSAYTNDSKAFYGISGIMAADVNLCAIGVGTGIEYWSNGFVLPIFADIKIKFSDSGIRPFAFGNLGYGIAKIKDIDGFDKGGVMFIAGFGGKTSINISSDILFEVGFFSQKAKVFHREYVLSNYSFISKEYLTDEIYSGIIFTLGVTL